MVPHYDNGHTNRPQKGKIHAKHEWVGKYLDYYNFYYNFVITWWCIFYEPNNATLVKRSARHIAT